MRLTAPAHHLAHQPEQCAHAGSTHGRPVTQGLAFTICNPHDFFSFPMFPDRRTGSVHGPGCRYV